MIQKWTRLEQALHRRRNPNSQKIYENTHIISNQGRGNVNQHKGTILKV